MLNSQLIPATANRPERSLALRIERARKAASVPAPDQIDNGDEARYADKSGTYTKGILQSGIGLVDLDAYRSFKKALASGAPADFQHIVLGGPRTLNGPQGGLAFYLDCLDSSQFAVPPAPALASEAYATELIELYWASLLRDARLPTILPVPSLPRQQLNCRRCQPTRDHAMLPTKSPRTCCSVAILRVRRRVRTCRNFCSRIPRSGRCRSHSDTRQTRRN